MFVGRAGQVAVLGCATLRHSSTRARNFSAIEGAQYIKLKNPHADVTVRDLEGIEETNVIPPQQPQDPGSSPPNAKGSVRGRTKPLAFGVRSVCRLTQQQ